LNRLSRCNSGIQDPELTPTSRPAGSRLAALAQTLGRTGWAVELFDAQWRLAWVSDSLKAVLGESDERRLGGGRHLAEAWTSEVRRTMLSPESRARSLAEITAFTLNDTPGGKEALRSRLGERWPPELDPVTPAPAPDLWAWSVDFEAPGATVPNRVQALMVRCRDEAGAPIGTFFVYSSGLPANILALLVRGDEELFKRTAELIEARRHAAAILFADLEGSGTLVTRLKPRLYFELLRSLLTGIDGLVADHGGIVGKHGGDGATAFFLSDQLGGNRAAARAALEVARSAPTIASNAAVKAVGTAGSELQLRVNVGVHWADQLYLGQVITGGRLEVTALGAEVNECARLQESAHGGESLASKAVLDQLGPADRSALGLTEGLAFRALGDLPTAAEKVRRDAGDLLATPLTFP
jgi:class 3 adenylate cyclase